MDPVEALEEIAFWLELAAAPTYRVTAFRKAAEVLRDLPDGRVEELAAAGRLTSLPGIGKATATVIGETLAGREPTYLAQAREEVSLPDGGPLLSALRGDCHVHSDWSDGGAAPEAMARTARSVGREYIVLTDHSPRLKVAKGLSPERLREQLRLVDELNRELAPFRVLTGIEVDILEDGSLDQEPDLLGELDIVVGSVHSALRLDRQKMTRRLVAAIANPHLDILGHCTGRLLGTSDTPRGRRRAHEGQRPESEFDPELVFAAVRHFDKALELNCRPERLDPPRRLLALAAEAGCRFAINSDAHAQGQLGWLPYGCRRAADAGVTSDRVVNVMEADALIEWTRTRP